MTVRSFGALLICVVLASCGSSPPTRYFTLTPTNGSQTQVVALGAPVQVTALHLPDALDRQQMVLGGKGNAVTVSGSDRWNGPLDVMARRILTEDLAQRLGRAHVIPSQAPPPSGTDQIVVTVTDFGPGADHLTILQANWALLDNKSGKTVLSRNVSLRSPAIVAKPDQVAASMSDVLGQLASRIAATLGQRQQLAARSQAVPR